MRNKKQEIIEFCEYQQKHFLCPCSKCKIQDICIEHNFYKYPFETIEEWTLDEINSAYNIINKSISKIGELLWNM